MTLGWVDLKKKKKNKKLCQTFYILKTQRGKSTTDNHNRVQVWFKRHVFDDLSSADPFGTSSQWGLTFGWLLHGSHLPCLGPKEFQHWPSNSLGTCCLSECSGTGCLNIRTDLSTDLETAACPEMYEKEGYLIHARFYSIQFIVITQSRASAMKFAASIRATQRHDECTDRDLHWLK